MATAFIHSGSRYFYGMCKAYFEVYGHTVTDCADSDVAIIDLDYRAPPTVTEAKLTVFISASSYALRGLPENAILRLKPVDVDVMMDLVLDEMKRIL